ncbi:hypothetical protein BGZ76_001994 [Entomortierella beljakovae]|nr:hypothetical protein BGZ76_001994 [Entomortierella beljakovae]
MIDQDPVIPTTQVQLTRTLDTLYGGSLPDDCLHAIINHLRKDYSELYNLLFVSKFFFSAAVRHLYKNQPSPYSRNKLKLQKFYSILFVSFLQERVMESMAISGNDKTPAQIVEEVLKKFGLELVVPYQPSGISFLQNMYGPISFYNEIECDPNSLSPLTIDYSKLFRKLSIGQIDRRKIFMLRISPESNDDNDTQEHGIIEKVTSGVFTTLQLAIIDMWVHYNHSYISWVSFEPSIANKFLPHATKLSNLETLDLYRRDTLTDTDLKDTVSFITRNQLTFRHKIPLNVLSWDKWKCPELNNTDFAIEAIDKNTYISSLRSRQNTILQQMRPILAIYEAVMRPSILRVNHIPNFYNLSQNIEVDRLVELYDCHIHRVDMGESEMRGKFLQNCSNLRTLEICVDHQGAFSWATQERVLSLGTPPLMRLEKLKIVWSTVCHAAIMALNDAVNIFSSSLREVSVEFNSDGDFVSSRGYVANVQILRSLQLNRLTAGNTIGNFRSLVPNLSRMEIKLIHASINVGSLDFCPNLEHLVIKFGREPIFAASRPQGDEPTTLPEEPGVNLDHNWKIPVIVSTLFPAWNLPKLKSLRLQDRAAMRFDFASLPTMQKLESLSICTGFRNCHSKEEIYGYMARQCKILSDSTSTSSVDDQNNQHGIFGPYSNMDWTLPNLSAISIEGMPSSVFCLEYLRLFPALESIRLVWNGIPKVLHRGPIPIQKIMNPIGSFTNECAFNDKPIMQSQLKKIELYGDWKMTILDLTSLLKVYAPFLRGFYGGRLELHDSDGVYGLFESVNRVWNMNMECDIQQSQQDELHLTGSTLGYSYPTRRHLKISAQGEPLTDIETEKIGMKEVNNADFQICKDLGMITYHRELRRYRPQHLIGVKDYKILEGEKALRKKD